MGVGAVEFGDEMGGGFHPLIGRLAQRSCSVDVARSDGVAGECVEDEDLDVGLAAESGGVEDRDESFVSSGHLVDGIHRGEQAFTERCLFSAACGAICGAAIGAAQAVVLHRRLGRIVWAWPVVLAALWALGWITTASAGIDVESQYTVFGSSGALVVTAGTSILAIELARRHEPGTR